MKKAFTLIELLIVIGILAVLIAVLVAAMGGGTDAARAARCLTNLKNLASACHSYAMAQGEEHPCYPLAGSIEVDNLRMSFGSGVSKTFSEMPGWLSWDSRGAYEGKTTSHVASGSWFTSSYNKDFDVRQHALTNGVLWKYVSENADVYMCPAHRKAMRLQKPLWSYVMNERFGYDRTLGSGPVIPSRCEYGRLSRSDRVLMFSELQFLANDRVEVSTDSGPGIKNDCTLQYSRNEVIGFNHPSGKRGLFAHVAFADGHTEKILIPATPTGDKWTVSLNRSELEDLTKWLCQGKDVSFNGSRYEKLED